MGIIQTLYFLLHDEPNKDMSSFIFRETLTTHLLLRGYAYAQFIRNGKGEMIGLYLLIPDWMKVDRDDRGQIFYEYSLNSNSFSSKNGKVKLKREDVLHILGLGFDGLMVLYILGLLQIMDIQVI